MQLVIRSILHGGPIELLLVPASAQNWYIKGYGMCYPGCGMVHIKDHLLLFEKSSLCSGGRGFPLSLSEWSFTICPMPYNFIKMCCVSH